MNIRNLDLNLLRVLDAVAREGSVSAAATRLGLSQPAVSNALARLRRELGDPLFVRTPRGMRPTPLAGTLAEPVRQALALLEATLAGSPGFEPATSTRSFRFYMSDIGEIFFLPPLIERLHQLAPRLHLEAVALAPEDVAEGLATGRIDLAVGFLPELHGAVHRQVIFRDPYVCLLRADHPHIGARLTRRQFGAAQHALVASPGSGHRVIEQALARRGLRRHIALRVPHFTVLPQVLERTDLVLTLPARIAQAFARERALRIVAPPVQIPPAEVAIHWHERFDRDPAIGWLRQLLLAMFGDGAGVTVSVSQPPPVR